MPKQTKNFSSQNELKAQIEALIIEDANISKANKAKLTKDILNKDSWLLWYKTNNSPDKNSNIITGTTINEIFRMWNIWNDTYFSLSVNLNDG